MGAFEREKNLVSLVNIDMRCEKQEWALDT